MSARMYINATCKVGQSKPCGREAVWSIAVTEVADTASAAEGRTGGVVALCERHATTAVSKWDAPPPGELAGEPNAAAGWVEAMRQQQRVERVLMLVADARKHAGDAHAANVDALSIERALMADDE